MNEKNINLAIWLIAITAWFTLLLLDAHLP